jgi:ABC-type uncharacterized transport system substrate-binding protein
MRGREFMTLVCAAASSVSWSLEARAQQARYARVGFLGLGSASSHTARMAAFRAGLRDLGWVEGRNVHVEFRWTEGSHDRLPALAQELVRLNVDVLVSHGVAGALAAKKATSTIPIVITAVSRAMAETTLPTCHGVTFADWRRAAKRDQTFYASYPSVDAAGARWPPGVWTLGESALSRLPHS